MGLFTRFLNKFRPALSERDRKAVQSLQSMKTLQVHRSIKGCSMSIEYSDVQQEMHNLHNHTQQLFNK
jgi:hypothetical protein